MRRGEATTEGNSTIIPARMPRGATVAPFARGGVRRGQRAPRTRPLRGKKGIGPVGLAFHLDDVAAHVVPAIRANDVRRRRRAALGAVRQLLWFLVVVGPPAAGPGVRLSALGNCHDDPRGGRMGKAQYRRAPAAMRQAAREQRLNSGCPWVVNLIDSRIHRWLCASFQRGGMEQPNGLLFSPVARAAAGASANAGLAPLARAPRQAKQRETRAVFSWSIGI